MAEVGRQAPPRVAQTVDEPGVQERTTVTNAGVEVLREHAAAAGEGATRSDAKVEDTAAPPLTADPVVNLEESLPGIYVDPDIFIVLHTRLGRPQEAVPKLNPQDPNEQTRYHTPDPWERGEMVRRENLPQGPARGYKDAIDRLIQLRAIAPPSDPEAQDAIRGRAVIQRTEMRVATNGGFVPGAAARTAL